jgi:hypothetical protein
MVTAAARLKLKDSRSDVQLSLFVAVTAAAGFATGKLAEPWMGSFPPRVAAFCEGALMFVVVSGGWAYWFYTRRARAQQRVLLSA